jgi:hypothetical protein
MQTDFKASAEQLQSDWLTAIRAELEAVASHPPTNILPALVSGKAQVDQAQTPWGNAERSEISAHGILPPLAQFHLFDTNLVWPARLEAVAFDASVLSSNIQSAEIQVEQSTLTATWRAPQLKLQVTNILYRGELAASGSLNTSTREVTFSGMSTMDAHKVASLLTTRAQDWLSNYSWQTPPKVQAQGRLILPAWTNHEPDWRAEVMPSMAITGNFQIAEGAYRNVSFTSAESPFWFSNLVWCLPRVKVVRPEGSVEGEYTSHPETKEFHWRVRSQIDPKVTRAFFEEESQRRAFDYVEFPTPPLIEAEIWGHWQDLDRFGVMAFVAATNFAFRGEHARDAATHIIYTNRVLTFIEPRVHRDGGEHGSAPGITIDFNQLKVFFTNTFGNLNPHAVARTIGKGAARAIEPYQFDSPPTIRVQGVVDLKRKRNEEDLHFEVSGGPFRWKQFRLQQLVGNIAWQARVLSLLNVRGAMSGGHVTGHARFDFTDSNEPTFSFQTAVTNVDLRPLMQNLSAKTNKLEGILSGEVVVARARAYDLQSWQGSGHVNVRDGLLWEIPVLGIFSDILNTIIPGLGNSRAKQATADFIITNSVIDSRNLEIHATAMRMRMEGTVDFQRRLDARVEAELLRDVPGIGFVISKLFWPVTKLFEYKVTGTLNEPKAEPLYVVPKILLMPLHPIRTVKEMFSEEPKSSPQK